MAHTYIDITAGTNKLRDAIAVNHGGSSLTALKVYRLAAGTYNEDLGASGKESYDYVRIEPAVGAEGSVIVQHTHTSGFRLGQTAGAGSPAPNYWFFEDGIEWRARSIAGGICWSLQCTTANSGGPIEIRGHSKLMSTAGTCVKKTAGGNFTAYFYGTAEGDSATGSSKFYDSGGLTTGGTFYVRSAEDRPGLLDPTIWDFASVFLQQGSGDLDVGANRIKGFEKLFDLDNAGYALNYEIRTENLLAWDQRGSSYGFVFMGNHGGFTWVPDITMKNTLFADGAGYAFYSIYGTVSGTIETENLVLYDIANGTNISPANSMLMKNAIAWLCPLTGGTWWSLLTTEPEFVAPLDSPPDYHSPWGWLGQDNGWASGVTVDLDGVARPQGASIDRGPYEALPADGGLLSATPEDAETVLVAFDPAKVEPLEASAENVANWSVTGDYAIALATSTRLSAFSYRVTLSRPTVLGEIVEFDATSVATVSSGFCVDPATVDFAGLVYPDGEVKSGRALSSRRVRVRFKDDPWLSIPTRVGATSPSSWIVTREVDAEVSEVVSVEMVGSREYILTLGADLASGQRYRVDTSGVETEDGGTC